MNLDDFILSQVGPNWTKVAMVVAKAMTDAQQKDGGVVAARIKALVAAGLLEAQGNLSEWRNSEIRKVKA